MGFRITTWNVNGIRNPFSYQPWRDTKTFAAMFDILEADIVIFQETKIQRKDLRDDMVLVPGWDCYFSLPRHKKGYSGVVIFTRQSVCCPIRAEEGITGVLCPPNSSTSFSDLPENQQIGGYPTLAQATDILGSSSLATDFATLDSEGRCVVLEFPAMVLIGVYSPANRDETRDDFRLGFLNLLDARVRNLIHMGKRVFLTGDLNISKEELDTANAESAMRKNSMTPIEYFSTPARRLFNHLLEDGRVYGERDPGREEPVLWDICRGFHPTRKGMFTCWEQKVNARPGNFGARIDYVLCSFAIKAWFSDSNIQEGLMGSDHCPVYATIKDRICVNGLEVDVRDLMNPPGMFSNGQRQREYTVKDILPLSGRLIPEFDRRQSIRDMFSKRPIIPVEQSTQLKKTSEEALDVPNNNLPGPAPSADAPADRDTLLDVSSANHITWEASIAVSNDTVPSSPTNKRASSDRIANRPSKRGKPAPTSQSPTAHAKGQQSLKGFFQPRTTVVDGFGGGLIKGKTSTTDRQALPYFTITPTNSVQERKPGRSHDAWTTTDGVSNSRKEINPSVPLNPGTESPVGTHDFHDPIESKESWSKLFTKPAAPRCEGHEEPCVSLLTKKNGINCGRSFWMCSRPLGPSGAKEKGTQWRCQTFIWCSDWNPSTS